MIRVTSRCDQRCYFCRQRALNNLYFDDMTIDNFRKILDRYRGAIQVILTGGEPFLHKGIFNMIKYAHLKKMYVSASTNGANIYDKIDRIINTPLSLLNISLNALDSRDYKVMHGESKYVFNTVLENIAGLVEKRDTLNKHLKVSISYTCTKGNYTKIPNMVRFAEELNVDELVFQNLIPVAVPEFNIDQSLYEDDSEVTDVMDSIEPPTSKLRVIMPRLLQREITERLCKMPFTILHINSECDVSPCCVVKFKRKYGNILEDDNVWNNFYYRRIRKILLTPSIPLPEVCKTCHIMLAS